MGPCVAANKLRQAPQKPSIRQDLQDADRTYPGFAATQPVFQLWTVAGSPGRSRKLCLFHSRSRQGRTGRRGFTGVRCHPARPRLPTFVEPRSPPGLASVPVVRPPRVGYCPTRPERRFSRPDGRAERENAGGIDEHAVLVPSEMPDPHGSGHRARTCASGRDDESSEIMAAMDDCETVYLHDRMCRIPIHLSTNGRVPLPTRRSGSILELSVRLYPAGFSQSIPFLAVVGTRLAASMSEPNPTLVRSRPSVHKIRRPG